MHEVLPQRNGGKVGGACAARMQHAPRASIAALSPREHILHRCLSFTVLGSVVGTRSAEAKPSGNKYSLTSCLKAQIAILPR
eukprot:7086003-Prymnesium_polylepis.1